MNFWGFLRLISGFSFYALLIIVESWLNEKSSNSQRGQILAIYTIIFYLSTALGQLFLTIPKDSEFLYLQLVLCWYFFFNYYCYDKDKRANFKTF